MKKLLKKIKYDFLPYITGLRIHLKGNECTRFKDNVLLAKLIAKAPRYYDRALEYPWALKNIELKKGKLLDVGSTVSKMFKDNLSAEVEVFAINSDKEQRFEKNSGIKSVFGDIRKTDFKTNMFDVITCISTLEHIGVGGRYGIVDEPNGDTQAMKEMFRILKPNGTLLVTVPYGLRDVLPINKLYNKRRIEKLTQGYEVESETYMKYDEKYNIWKEVEEVVAGKVNWQKERWYALALIKLIKPR